MKKIIRLTESELIKLVNKIVTETLETSDMYKDMDMIEIARSQLGVPYKWGYMGPKESDNPGFDCSGFVKWVLKTAGFFNRIDGSLRTDEFNKFAGYVQGQYNSNKIAKIKKPDIKPGDFVYFTHEGDEVMGHVGIITNVSGDDFSMIHAANGGIEEVDNVIEKGWWGDITGYGRFMGTRILPTATVTDK
jgi:cell wall-associated NlpC family hydrolase